MQYYVKRIIVLPEKGHKCSEIPELEVGILFPNLPLLPHDTTFTAIVNEYPLSLDVSSHECINRVAYEFGSSRKAVLCC